jgi:hypothetical protein
MTRSLKTLFVALVIATPMLSSCSESIDPTSAAPVVAPQQGLIGDLLGVVGDVVGLVGTIVTGPDANGDAVEKWIGSGGGSLTTAAYTLTVPSGAVSQSTRFRITPTNTGAYAVDLSAHRKGGLLNLSLIEVGSKGFAKPVKLTIKYANATNVTAPNSLVILYIRSDGTVETQTTVVNTTTETANSSLSHFSKYAMAQN